MCKIRGFLTLNVTLNVKPEQIRNGYLKNMLRQPYPGPMASMAQGPMGQWPDGPMALRALGHCPWPDGPMAQGPMGQWPDGPMARWEKSILSNVYRARESDFPPPPHSMLGWRCNVFFLSICSNIECGGIRGAIPLIYGRVFSRCWWQAACIIRNVASSIKKPRVFTTQR